MPELIEPDSARHAAWLESHYEWGPGLHEDGFGISPHDDVKSAAGFAAWVERLRSLPAQFRWIVEQDAVLGGIVLRPVTNESVLRVGHIGYGIRPSARGNGLATWGLSQALRLAQEASLERVLLVCLDDNPASIKVIEKCGGVLARIMDDRHGLARHYWVDLETLKPN